MWARACSIHRFVASKSGILFERAAAHSAVAALAMPIAPQFGAGGVEVVDCTFCSAAGLVGGACRGFRGPSGLNPHCSQAEKKAG